MRVLLVGAGGAARAAVCALLDDGAASITVVNRSADRTRRLAAQFGSPTSLQLADRVPPDTFDLAVNATTLGLRAGDPLPLEPGVRAGAALDLVYTPEETPWVRRMRERGIPAADGREMLLQQGAAAFRLWFGKEPPMDVMQRALGLGG
jgi:shikimate dehydrogenase